MFERSEERASRRQCVTCGTLSPATETNYTLISSQHGWRLTRELDRSGQFVMQWRCPKCWAKHKALVAAR